MKRKLIKQANSAYTLTLPIGWVRANGLSEKNELEVLEKGKSLLITNEDSMSVKKTKLDASNLGEISFYQYLSSIFAAGFDEVEIVSEKDISSRVIRAINSLIGYALVSQEGNSWVVKDIGGTGNVDLDEIFKRVFQSVLLFYNSSLEDVFGKSSETHQGLDARDAEVNKLCLYLQRAINKMSYPDPIKGRLLYTYSYGLENIGDSILRFWRTNIIGKTKKPSDLKGLANLTKEVLEKTFDLYYRFNPLDVEKIRSLKLQSRKEFDNNLGGPLKRHLLKIIEDASELAQLTIMIQEGSK